VQLKQSILAFILLLSGIYCQGQDTVYFNKNWEPITKIKSAVYYRVIKQSDGLYIVNDYYSKKKLLQMHGQYSDAELKIPVGEFVWLDLASDTTTIRTYTNGQNTSVIMFEDGKREYRVRFINDSTSTTNNYLGKFEIDKRLFIGKREYHFRGNDSILNTKLFRYAFKNDWPYTNVLVIKGKALPWFIIEEVGMVYSLGFEYSFRHKHSIELQGTYLDHEHDAENSNGDPIPTTYTVRRSAQLGYRYYFTPCKKFNEYNHKMYVSPFVRYAKWHDYYEPGSVTAYTRNETWNYSAGILAGYCIATGDRSYLDFFAGPQVCLRYNQNTQKIDNQFVNQTTNKTIINARIGFNFCYLLFRKSKTK
jgi:hypothetical protein